LRWRLGKSGVQHWPGCRSHSAARVPDPNTTSTTSRRLPLATYRRSRLRRRPGPHHPLSAPITRMARAKRAAIVSPQNKPKPPHTNNGISPLRFRAPRLGIALNCQGPARRPDGAGQRLQKPRPGALPWFSAARKWYFSRSCSPKPQANSLNAWNPPH